MNRGLFKQKEIKFEEGEVLELNTHYRGKITELKVAQAFLSRGIQVSQPLVSDSRYDFIIDVHSKLIRLQVKTARDKSEDGLIIIATSSSHTNTKRTINITYSTEDVDYFATYWDGNVYIFPVKGCPQREMKIRLVPPKNGQQIGVRMLNDYTLDKFLETLDV